MSDMPSILSNDFSARSTQEGDSLIVVVAGEIDLENPCAVLDPFFEEIHKSASSSSREVQINIRELKFVNSSGIKSFIRWISHASQSKAYKICFLCNKSYTWQQMSLSVIQMIAPDLVRSEN